MISSYLINRFESGAYSASGNIDFISRLIVNDIGAILYQALKASDQALVNTIVLSPEQYINEFFNHLKKENLALSTYNVPLRSFVRGHGNDVNFFKSLCQLGFDKILNSTLYSGSLVDEKGARVELTDSDAKLLSNALPRKVLTVSKLLEDGIVTLDKLDPRLLVLRETDTLDWFDVFLRGTVFQDNPSLSGTYFDVNTVPSSILSNPILCGFHMMTKDHIFDHFDLFRRKHESFKEPIDFVIESTTDGYFNRFYNEFDGYLNYDDLHSGLMDAFSNGQSASFYINQDISNRPYSCNSISELKELLHTLLNSKAGKFIGPSITDMLTEQSTVVATCRNIGIHADKLVGSMLRSNELSLNDKIDLKEEVLSLFGDGKIGSNHEKSYLLSALQLSCRDLCFSNIAELLSETLSVQSRAKDADKAALFYLDMPMPTLKSVLDSGRLNASDYYYACKQAYMMKTYYPENYYSEFLMLKDLILAGVKKHVSTLEILDNISSGLSTFDSEFNAMIHTELNSEKKDALENIQSPNDQADMSFLQSHSI